MPISGMVGMQTCSDSANFEGWEMQKNGNSCMHIVSVQLFEY